MVLLMPSAILIAVIIIASGVVPFLDHVVSLFQRSSTTFTIGILLAFHIIAFCVQRLYSVLEDGCSLC
jgi:hypothetical protein